MENKIEILNSFAQTLNLTRACGDVESIGYRKDDSGEYAVIRYDSGLGIVERKINITADSGIAMIYDIVKAFVE